MPNPKEWCSFFLENVPDGFAYNKLILDGQGNPIDFIILKTNKIFEEITGLERGNITGKRATEVFSGMPFSKLNLLEMYGKVALTGESYSCEQYCESLERWYFVRALSDKKGYFGIIYRDITESKRLQERIKELNCLYGIAHLTGLRDASGDFRYDRKKAEEALQNIEWMLSIERAPSVEEIKAHPGPPYGKLTELNTTRFILDHVGEDVLIDIAREYLGLLDTSTSIFEKNGDYVLGIYSSGWCRLLDSASRKLCRTDDNKKALQSGKWLCHESCWTQASKTAIETGQPVDIACHGGIRLYAVPIRANNQVVGAIDFAYGDPPRQPEKLQELAEKYQVRVDELARQARAYKSRPPFIIGLAKERLHSSARLIGSLIEQKQAEEGMRKAEETLSKRLAELEALFTFSSSLRSAETLDELLPLLLDETLSVLKAEAGAIWLHHPPSGELRFAAARGWLARYKTTGSLNPEEGVAKAVFTSGEPYITRELAGDPLFKPPPGAVPKGWGAACLPINTAMETVGVFFISVPLPREITKEETRLLTSLAEMIGTAVHRISLHEETVRRCMQLQSLRAIDQAINASLDLKLTLNILLEQVTKQLKVDASCVYLLHPHMKTLNFTVGRGFNTKFFEQIRLRLGEAVMGKAALERRTVVVSSIGEAVDEKDVILLQAENFAGSTGVPLISKGEVKGVLGIFQKTSRKPDPEWLDFLETLAGQAAIAIDNARLFEDLQHANLELVLAYDATIEGWARALELRDHETEGHSQRVAEMTVMLASAMDIPGEKLVHIYRGALLHDIGKMGVPDTILLKPGPLTEDEWEIMRRHPALAFEMLSPVEYLRPALDIPYCHHEKWDGTGYPRGLKGEEIPLEARIFALVDVYDALTSHRPYRKAWTREKTLEYIKKESGRQFDSRVVRLFLKEM